MTDIPERCPNMMLQRIPGSSPWAMECPLCGRQWQPGEHPPEGRTHDPGPAADAMHPSYVLSQRAAGGWWIMRHPDDTAGDTHGYVDGWAEQIDERTWRATSWDRETVVLGFSCAYVAERLVELRWSEAIPEDDGPTGLDPAQQDVALAAVDARALDRIAQQLQDRAGGGGDADDLEAISDIVRTTGRHVRPR